MGNLRKYIFNFLKISSKICNLFKNKIDPNELSKFGNLLKIDGNRAIIHVERSKGLETAAKILDKFEVEDILITEPDLEEIIQKFYGTS